MPRERLAEWANSADFIVAADGGADRLLEVNVAPHLTLGDRDSASEEAIGKSKTFLLLEDQDTTDCDKVLNWLVTQGVQNVTLAGLEGDLVDHVLGSFQSIAKSPLYVRLVLRRGMGWILRGPTEFECETDTGTRVSLIPITECQGVSLEGVHWAFKNQDMSPVGFTSLSNRAAGSSAQISLKKGIVFLFTETSRAPFWP